MRPLPAVRTALLAVVFLVVTASSVHAASPVVELLLPAPGAAVRELLAVEVGFDQAVDGVEAADLLVNGAPCTNVVEAAEGHFVFAFPEVGPGTNTFVWRADHNIRSRADATQWFAGGEWSVTVLDPAVPPRVILSEFMAANTSTLRDEDGDYSDWIELFNGEEAAVDLEGWWLTDDPATPTKWRFPAVSIAAKSFLVVFASEKNRTNIDARLHTNFRLTEAGEYLALLSPATNVLSAFAPAYPPQQPNVSYGRAPGTVDTAGYFEKPTPGAANSATGASFAPSVAFSREGGPFTNAFTLTLSVADPRATLYYTVDGTLPGTNSPVYTTPLSISNTVAVRARSYQAGLLPGPVTTETYLLLAADVRAFSSDLPILVMHTLGKGTAGTTVYRAMACDLFEPVHGRSALTRPPHLATRGGLKLRGSSTEGLAKSSFAMEFWDDFGLDRHLSPLGLPAESDWVLYAPNIYEPVMIHNPFIHQLSREMGRYSPRTRFVEVYYNRSGGAVKANDYMGIYVLEEKIKIGKDRVNIDHLEPEDSAPPALTGGYLLKIDRLDPGDTGMTGSGATVLNVDPKERELKQTQRAAQYQYIKNYFKQFGAALASTTWRDPKSGYAAYADVDAWIDFHVLEVLSGNVDTLVLSTYFHKPRNGRIVFGPHWDFDRALGSTDGRDSNPRVWSTGPFFSAAWWSKLFTDVDFWQRWVDRWQEARQNQFSLAHMNGLIDSLTAELREAQPREQKKWRTTYRGGSYQSEINHMKNWVSNRVAFIDGQLTPRPRLGAPGGLIEPNVRIAITGATNAVIYYTLDGTDPRAAQGTVSPQAKVYTTPIALSGNARLVARARNANVRQSGGPPATTPWSGPVAATYVLSLPSVVLTEVMFHPGPVPAGDTNPPADYEFVELCNTGTLPVVLPGLRLTNGLDFVFTSLNSPMLLAPGERLLVARNPAALRARYQPPATVLGPFAGALDNASPRLTLLGSLGEVLFDVTLQSEWAPLTDGFGFSLVLADETTPANKLGEPARWRGSAHPGGSPGLPDPAPVPIPTVWINEVVSGNAAHDAVELYCPDAEPVNIGDWYLTDDYRTPAKFRFPAGTWMDAEGYLVVTDADFGAGPAGFGLSAAGDDIFLFSANASGELTGYVHGFHFGPLGADASFGRVVTLDGREQFLAQSRATLHAPNADPRVGPVVFSEALHINASLAATNVVPEYLELLNTSSDPVPLFLPDHPEWTWRLRGDLDFDFPTNLVLPPGGTLCVTAFDPSWDAQAWDALRRIAVVPPEALFVGPWQGAWSIGGANVKLQRPVAPRSGTTPDWALVESVTFGTSAPWPAWGDPAWLALNRQHSAAFGDDARNWAVSPTTPGGLDQDGDGLPDWWEDRYDLDPLQALGQDGSEGDPDGDGVTNRDEFWSGSDPRSATSRLEFLRVENQEGAWRLVFPSAVGRRYTLLESTNAVPAQWRAIDSMVATGEVSAFTPPKGFTETGRYYRLQVP